MPVVAPSISSAILSQMSLKRLTGKNAIDIASAVGSAVANYIVIPNRVTCTLNGTAGPIGNINSIAVLGLVPTAMSGFMLSKAGLRKLTGRDIKNFFDAISFGLFQVLSTMILSGTSAGCAVGAGTGKFTAVSEQALSKLILAEFLKKRLRGKNNRDLADCIAFGIIRHLQSSVTFTVAVTGAIAPTPPTGPIAVVGIPSLTTKVS